MKLDSVVERVREVRRKISEEFNHDPISLVNYYIRLDREYRKEKKEYLTSKKSKE